jgi:hypothetical protein
MANKENKGGELTNEQLEKDLKVRGKDNLQGGYVGMQDTGDGSVRKEGTEVQKMDGIIDRDGVSTDE